MKRERKRELFRVNSSSKSRDQLKGKKQKRSGLCLVCKVTQVLVLTFRS